MPQYAYFLGKPRIGFIKCSNQHFPTVWMTNGALIVRNVSSIVTALGKFAKNKKAFYRPFLIEIRYFWCPFRF